jgi:hypothetical protein
MSTQPLVLLGTLRMFLYDNVSTTDFSSGSETIDAVSQTQMSGQSGQSTTMGSVKKRSVYSNQSEF